MEGVFQKCLVINLSQKKCHHEYISEEVYTNYLGGKGLGLYLLLKKTKPGIDALSPENIFIIALGPVNDTKIWGSSRYGIFTKSPLTGLFAESYSGGRVAEAISRTGFDAILLQGVCSQPTILEISDEGVDFHEGVDLWGLDSHETQDLLSKKIGKKHQGIIVIGPAGENLVRFASVMNNYSRCAGRTGTGAVLGSKKVKALVFYGKTERKVAETETVIRLHDEWGQKGKNHPSANFFKNFGTPGLVSIINTIGAFPTFYWAEGVSREWHNISGETLHNEFRVTPNACNRCFMACGRLTTVTKGRHKGLKIEGPEYETIYAFGGLCAINSLDEIIYLNDICNRFGMDTITSGNLASFAIEASRRGKIKDKLDYGDADAIASILHRIVRKEGIGAVLSEGIKHAAKEWGLEDLAIHVRGMEPAGYDPRILKGMGLAYATSDRGACHMRTTAFKPEISGIIPPDQIEGKAEIIVDYEDRCSLMDALVLCRFYRDLYLWDELGVIIAATTGMKLDRAGLQVIASNIRNAARYFNVREGVAGEQDTLPRRFFEEGIGPQKCVITREELKKLKDDYYRLRGWNTQGVPVQKLPLL